MSASAMVKASLWASLIFSLLVATVNGQPANDFSFEIGNGYKIRKTSRINICIEEDDRTIIFSSGDYDHKSISPIIKYAVTRKFILTEHKHLDDDSLTFFAINKFDESVTGPLSDAEMQEVLKANQINLSWKCVSHPLVTFTYWLSFSMIVVLATATALGFWRRVKKVSRLVEPTKSGTR